MMNFNVPQTPKIETHSDCDNLAFCEQLEITTRDCFRGAHPVKRCTQGDFAQIKMMAKILDHLNK